MHAISLDVLGSFGMGNFGDEIVPGCLTACAASAGLAIQCRPVSRYDNVAMPEVVSYSAYRREEGRSPMLVSGGGIIENHAMSCLDRALELQRADPLLRVEPFAISVEPGVPFRLIDRFRLWRKLRPHQPIYVRDQLSAATLGQLSPMTALEIVGDIGLWCQPDARGRELRTSLPERFVAVLLADNWSGDDFLQWLAPELVRTANELDAALLFLPLSLLKSDDLATAKRAAEAVRAIHATTEVIVLDESHLGEIPSGGMVAGILEGAILTISARLHGCVVSYAQRTPFVALAYHPKLYGFARTVEWEQSVFPAQMPARQSAGTYGYQFSDLDAAEGALFEAVGRALSAPDYSALDHYRSLQAKILASYFDA